MNGKAVNNKHQISKPRLIIAFKIIVLILYSCKPSDAQIIKKTAVDYAITTVTGRNIRFSKGLYDSIYSLLHFSISNSCDTCIYHLSEELLKIDNAWDMASDSIRIKLTSIFPGYPLNYKDVLQKQIIAFNLSNKWKSFLNQEDRSYIAKNKLIKDIMLSGGVYDMLAPLLNKYGYRIKGYDIEKTGYLTQKSVDKFNIDFNIEKHARIPIPYIVWINIAPIE